MLRNSAAGKGGKTVSPTTGRKETGESDHLLRMKSRGRNGRRMSPPTHTHFLFSFSLRCCGLRARHMLPKLSLQYAVVVLTGKYFLASPPPFPTPDSTPSTAIQAINGRGGRERGGGGRLLLRPRRRRHHTILQTGLFSPPPLGGRQQHLSLSLFPLSKQRQFGLPLFLLRCHRSLRGIVSCCHNHQRKKGERDAAAFLGEGGKRLFPPS